MAKERAERLLAYYMSMAWRRAGLTWSSDNEAEVGIIVDAFEAMIRDVVRDHTENAPHLHPDGSRG